MDVTDVLRDRMHQPAGLQRMVSISLAAHGALIAAMLFAPQGLLTRRTEPSRSVMTISIGGSGTTGPRNGGLTPIGGRPVQVQTLPDEPPKRQAERPPAAKAPEMTTPAVSSKAPQGKPAAPNVKAPDEARGRTPTEGAQVREGTAIAETGARGKGFGLSTGGSPGSGATLDVADFCCPEYIVQMIERIRSTWDQQGVSTAVVIVRFTIERDGKIVDPYLERSSGNPALDIAAQRAVVVARQLPPLPAQFPNQTLTVHLQFQNER
jgi:TonB family protein